MVNCIQMLHARSHGSPLSIFASRIYDGDIYHCNSWLNIENNLIDSITEHPQFSEQRVVGDHVTLIPGFIDLQVNGGGGVLFNNAPTLDGLTTILQAHHHLGTHALLATLITSHDDTILRALDAIEAGIEQNLPGLLGIHLEGPAINVLKRGIHFEKDIHIPSDKILAQLQQRRLGKVLMTLAPETVPPSIISELTDAGITIFAGHTNATASDAKASIENGVSGFTHLFNAMPAMLSRDPSILGVALTDRTTWGTIIHDTIHVDPIMVKIAIEAKSPERMILVTDAMATLGSDIDSFQFNDNIIHKQHNQLVNHEGKLAGAHISLAQSLLNTIDIGYSFETALQMVTKNPAKALNLYPQLGTLKNGAKANINFTDGVNIRPVL